MTFILRTYDYLAANPLCRRTILCALTALLLILAMGMTYKEDITDFMPLTDEEKVDMDIYQDVSGANKLVVLFTANNTTTGSGTDPDSTVAAIECFYDNVKKLDTLHWTNSIVTKFDMDKVTEVTDFVYDNIPYFLTDRDYARMDSILSSPEAVTSRLRSDKEMLMFPSGRLLSDNISRDPLNLFTPVVAKLQSQQQENKFEMYDGYIFTPDMSRAIVMLTSPFGNAETNQNAQLLELLDKGIQQMHQRYPKIEAHVIGGPQVAVGNAKQIKHDSLLAISLAVIFIILLLVISFRSIRNILLIAWSIGWGWLFALGGLALFHDSISIIVIGISSVILGIAVNYPLHVIAHTGHEVNIRVALKDIATPLLVGNITTVGAFVALIPLNSVALRDLGLFAALLLLGTIFYSVVLLPHQIKGAESSERLERPASSRLLAKGDHILQSIAEVRLDDKPWLVAAVLVLTVVFGWYSLQIGFDSNLSNINYMTDEQHADMAYFQRLMSTDTTSTKRTVYVVSSANSMEAALDTCLSHGIDGVSQFLVSQKEQARRLSRWRRFCQDYYDVLHTQLERASMAEGFSPDAFSEFYAILDAHYASQPYKYFEPLTSSVFAQNISIDKHTGRYSVVDRLSVKEAVDDGQNADLKEVEARYPGSFDIETLNSALANSLSDNFNYIGWACSLIVFFFLWFSFRGVAQSWRGGLELAVISFVPMAVSWLWILGIMALLGIKFNIVNIILATFIFGQGDDYTIFMTEGCLYEYKNKKPILASYKHSILLSAIIMFIGIGTLIVAQHPALKSLAEVTIVGMFSVVVMSWMIPPFLFRLLVKYHERKNL